MRKVYQYQKKQIVEVSLDNLVVNEPSYNPIDELFGEIQGEEIINSLNPLHQKICNYLIDGYSFSYIAKELNIPRNKIFKIKQELQLIIARKDQERYERFLKKNQKQVNLLFEFIKKNIGRLPLADFVYQHLNDYDPEAQVKKWKKIPLQNIYEEIWEKNQKSCILAPREHLKTTSLLQYIIKKVYNRPFPLEINYYHFNDELANEKFRKLKRYIENSPVISENFQLVESKHWSESKIELKDGTVIQPISYSSGAIGKHPHIIVLDDIIDKRVIYSDQLNKKAIDTFYSVIYPQISKQDEYKKIMIIGTVQRKDDIYNSLPEDFKVYKFQAIKEDGQPLEPNLFSLEDLERIKKDMSSKFGEKYWLKEYMNKPFEALGFIIKKEYFEYYSYQPPNIKIYQGWDLSVGKNIEKGDWTVGITIGIDDSGQKIKIYVLDIFRARLNLDQRIKAVIEFAQKWQPIQIGIEEVAFQYDTIQAVKNKTLFSIVGIKALKNKIESFQVDLAPYFENHQVYIRENMRELEQELLSLPVGEFDDQADALKIAIKTALYFNTVKPMISFI